MIKQIFKFYEISLYLDMQHKECPLTPYAYPVNAVEGLNLLTILYLVQGVGINDIIDCVPYRFVDLARQLIKRFGKIF